MEKMELVYFIFPTCDGKCKHCWSSDMHMGRYMHFDWHKKMIAELSERYIFKEIKISGGEPFFHPDIGLIIKEIRNRVGLDVPITVFTSGRTFVSDKKGDEGIFETKQRIIETFSEFRNVSIHLSADEFHMDVIKEKRAWSQKDETILFQNYIENFINACIELKKDEPMFVDPKLKIHCQKGRIEYHKNTLLSWIPELWWDRYCILTEGLVKSGRAKMLDESYCIEGNLDMLSYFLFPGVDFFDERKTALGERFKDATEHDIYMDASSSSGLIIPGWWNIINRTIKAYDKIMIEP